MKQINRHAFRGLWLMLLLVSLIYSAGGVTPARAQCARRVETVAFSPNQRLIASSGCGGVIKIWNADSGKLVMTAKRDGIVLDVAFLPDGKTLLVSEDGSEIRLLSIETGAVIRDFESKDRTLSNEVDLSPNGKKVVSGGNDGIITMWDVETGKATLSWEIPTGKISKQRLQQTTVDKPRGVNSIRFSPDGRTVLSGDENDEVKLWNAETGELIRVFKGHTSAIRSVAFSPDNRVIASGSFDETIKLWNIADGKQIATTKSAYGFRANTPHNLMFTPDGKLLLSTEHVKYELASVINIWNTATGKRIKYFAEEVMDIMSLVISKDGKYIVSGTCCGTVSLRNLATGELLRTFNHFPQKAAPTGDITANIIFQKLS